jgi:hypothetical protein
MLVEVSDGAAILKEVNKSSGVLVLERLGNTDLRPKA